MKVLARDKGWHFHTKLNCGFVDMDYKLITTAEALERKLLPCPQCSDILKRKLSEYEKGFDSGLALGLTCSIQHAQTMLKTWRDLLELK